MLFELPLKGVSLPGQALGVIVSLAGELLREQLKLGVGDRVFEAGRALLTGLGRGWLGRVAVARGLTWPRLWPRLLRPRLLRPRLWRWPRLGVRRLGRAVVHGWRVGRRRRGRHKDRAGIPLWRPPPGRLWLCSSRGLCRQRRSLLGKTRGLDG
jgi:hypothetical protein